MKFKSGAEILELLWSMTGWFSLAFCIGGIYVLVSIYLEEKK
ncbi:hypothetical protein [Allorhizobium ampelinum]|nr:hypothetical protein [Allorhizobium ampelinum]